MFTLCGGMMHGGGAESFLSSPPGIHIGSEPALGPYHQQHGHAMNVNVKVEVDDNMVPNGYMAGPVPPPGLLPHYTTGSLSPQTDMSMSPPGAGPGRTRKNKEDKICGVCGDKALGYNFDAISCESCKAFFRRNAPKGLEYFKCPYDEKCKMDISNRRFCKRCRLRKCFEIGMKKEYILTEEEKARKRQKIEENRTVREVERTTTTVPSPGTPPSMDLSAGSPESVTSTQGPRPLSEQDTKTIEELKDAYRASLNITVEKEPSREATSDMADLANIAEVSVRRVIDMAKKVTSFKSMPQPDQISLLKGGSIELLVLRSVISYDKEKQIFLDSSDRPEESAMTMQHFERGLGGGEGHALFKDHIRFVKSLAVDLEADFTTLVLLLVICLFSPDRPNLQCKQLVSDEQDYYSQLLKRYLESKYPLSVARNLYPKLLMKLVDIRNLNEEHSQVLLKTNAESIQPLMQEVLDLKSLAKTPGKDSPPQS